MSTSKRNGDKNPYERIPRETADEDIVTSEILQAALNHVNTKGWTEDAIRAGME
jgi:ubiquinone biosynthesis protein COQ9